MEKKNKTNGRTEQAWLKDGVGQEADHGVQTFDFSRDCIHGGVSAQEHSQWFRLDPANLSTENVRLTSMFGSHKFPRVSPA